MQIGIVGAGPVGTAAAYTCALRGLGRELVLVDPDPAQAAAEADDLARAVPFAEPIRIRAGGYHDLREAGVILVAAEAGAQPGETRDQRLQRQAHLFRELIPAILAQAPWAVQIVAAKPVDVMTHLAAQIAAEHGQPWGRIFGIGTLADTAHARALLAERLGVDSDQVRLSVLGEQGETAVLTWSQVSVGGLPLDAFLDRAGLRLPDAERESIEQAVRRANARIDRGKGAAAYGTGAALAALAHRVLQDERAVLTVCAPQDEVLGVPDVTLSLPHLIGGTGVLDAIDLALTAPEAEALRQSARRVRQSLASLGL